MHPVKSVNSSEVFQAQTSPLSSEAFQEAILALWNRIGKLAGLDSLIP